MSAFVDQLVKEIKYYGNIYKGITLETLYLGGGTPSLLSPNNLDTILHTVQHCFNIKADAEVTIECNPENITPSLLDHMNKLGFNRLSIGIQSFQEKELKLMRRSHNRDQALQSIEYATASGFENISIDLIYGIPGQSLKSWKENLSQALDLPITHLSAYHLTFEPGTLLDHWRKKEKIIPIPEELSVKQYALLREMLTVAGFDHYEISNFAVKEKLSEHNMLYWSGRPYLGLGPSAHSFDGTDRWWNVTSLKKYMEGMTTGREVRQLEKLSQRERYHDYLITSLRTRWGADPDHIIDQFGEKVFNHFQDQVQTFLEAKTVWKRDNHIAIHPDHWMVTDHILKKLFLD